MIQNRFGLSKKDIKSIVDTIITFEEIEMVKIFGSRAMGNYKKGSDVDIAIYGQNASQHIADKLKDVLNNQLPLPYFFDIANYSSIQNEELRNHIDKEGKLLFAKD